MLLHCGSQRLDLSTPIVMGIVNITPDSFSDGGQWLDHEQAIAHAKSLVQAGAGILDIGGESTRPGAVAVGVEEELRRVIPVIASLAAQVSVPISIDTSRAEVMAAAVAAGASIINDVRALREPHALAAAAATDAAICLMHMRGEPRTMQAAPEYVDVIREVREFLEARMQACTSAGIALERIALDPGIGFGKRREHNLQLLTHLEQLAALERPLLIGTSRKSLIGEITGKAVTNRLAGSLAFATAAVLAGASIIRAHDVAETVDVVRVAVALKKAQVAIPVSQY